MKALRAQVKDLDRQLDSLQKAIDTLAQQVAIERSSRRIKKVVLEEDQDFDNHHN